MIHILSFFNLYNYHSHSSPKLFSVRRIPPLVLVKPLTRLESIFIEGSGDMPVKSYRLLSSEDFRDTSNWDFFKGIITAGFNNSSSA